MNFEDDFIIYLLNGYYDHLKEYEQRLVEQTSKYLADGKTNDFEINLLLLQQNRESIKVLEDENLEPRDFLKMLIEKYELMK